MYTEFMHKGISINSKSHCDTLQKPKRRLRRIRPTRTTFLLHHNNVRPHFNNKTLEKFNRLKFEVIRHSLY